MTSRHNQVVVRLSNPTLYRLLMILAVMRIALAINFWTSNPTFNPYGISKTLIGTVFLILGLWHLVFLNVVHDLAMVRTGSVALIFFLTAWGLGNMQQSLAGEASFQLPLIYLAIAAVHYILLLEPPVNPMTRKRE